MPLSDIGCRSAKPKDRDYKISDAGGLYLLVRPNGSKLWRLNYRFAEKFQTLALGKYPQVTLADARRARDEAKSNLAKGLNPKQPDQVDAQLRFETIAREWFTKREASWKTAYGSRIWSRVERDILPALGEKSIQEVTPSEILDVLRSIEKRNALEIAKRTRQTVSSIFRYAIATGRASNDPAAVLNDALQARKAVRHMAALRSEQLEDFYKNLHAYEGERQTALALELIMHTFVRSNELRFATWSEINDMTWRIPAERMKMKKEHIVPLSRQVRRIFDELKAIAEDSEWVLPGASQGKPISENTMIYALYRMGYRSRATVHGFRSTASTILNESGKWRADAIERQLAHVPENEVRSAYNAALYLDERRQMMQWWSDYLSAKDPSDLASLLS